MVRRILVALLVLLFAAPAQAEDPTPGLRLEAETSPAAPYIQQEVILTVRLLRHSSLETGVFLTPETADVLLLPGPESEPRDVLRHGETLQMIEKRYRLFPQRSGLLEIPAPVFSGRSVYALGAPLRLEVRPRARTAEAGWWLPARSADLTTTWHLPAPPLRAGMPIERTVTLMAEGVTGAQLPPLPLPSATGVEARRLTVEVSESLEAGRLVGTRRERQRLVPGTAGPLALADDAVPWWDTTADAPRRAVAAGRTLSIAPPLPTAAPTPAAIAETIPATRPASPDPRVLATLLGVAAGFGCLAWWGHRRWSAPEPRRRRVLAAARRRTRAACRAGNAARARAALLDWCRAAWPDRPASLRDLGDRLPPPLADRLRELESHLYGRNAPASWDGTALDRDLVPALARLARPESPPPPPPLPDL